VAAAVGLGALISLPHLVLDDGRLVSLYIRRVKRCTDPSLGLTAAVDQSMHIVWLFAVALLASV
jgi:hypothetical protein